MNSKEIKADIAALEKAADALESRPIPSRAEYDQDIAAAKRLRRMAREIKENVLLVGTRKQTAPPITEFEKRLIDQR